jgi:hypothetical protein
MRIRVRSSSCPLKKSERTLRQAQGERKSPLKPGRGTAHAETTTSGSRLIRWANEPVPGSGGRVVVRSVTVTSLVREVPVAENGPGPQLLRCVVRADAAGIAAVAPVFPIGSIRCLECARAHPTREPERREETSDGIENHQ